MLFFFWVEFGGIFQSKTDIIEVPNKNIEYSKQEIQLEDARILGMFWNNKSHFIVLYDEDTKIAKVLEVDFSEWQYMDIGEM